MESIKEKSMIDALAYCDLRDLPKADTKEYIWLKALALVKKSDGTQSYVLLVKDLRGEPKVVKDFGSISVIRKIEEVYPFALLDAKFMPTFTTKTKEERITWLEKMNPDGDYSEMNMKQLNKEVLNVAMQNALRVLNNK